MRVGGAGGGGAGAADVSLREHGVDAGQPLPDVRELRYMRRKHSASPHLLGLQTNLYRVLGLVRSFRLQFSVVLSHKMGADFVVQHLQPRVGRGMLHGGRQAGAHRLHAPLAVRPSQQQSAAGKHGRGDDAVVPRHADDALAAQAGEVGANAAVNFIRGQEAAVAVLFPLRPAPKLLENAAQHVRGSVGVAVAVRE